MKLNEMNFSQYPDKLPSFMVKYGNEMITSYLEADEELMEHDQNRLIKYYKLSNSTIKYKNCKCLYFSPYC